MWSWQKLHIYKHCSWSDQPQRSPVQLPAAAPAPALLLKKFNFPQYYAERQYEFCSNPLRQASQRSRMPSLKNLRPRMLRSNWNISESLCNISHTFSHRSAARPLHFCSNPPTHDENSKRCFFYWTGLGCNDGHNVTTANGCPYPSCFLRSLREIISLWRKLWELNTITKRNQSIHERLIGIALEFPARLCFGWQCIFWGRKKKEIYKVTKPFNIWLKNPKKRQMERWHLAFSSSLAAQKQTRDMSSINKYQKGHKEWKNVCSWDHEWKVPYETHFQIRSDPNSSRAALHDQFSKKSISP